MAAIEARRDRYKLAFLTEGVLVLVVLSAIYGWLPWWAFALVLLSTIVLSQKFVLHFSGLAHKRIQSESGKRFEARIRALEEYLRPKLEILFEKTSPYLETWESGSGGGVTHFGSRFRIGVYNGSGKEIERVQVGIEGLIGLGKRLIPSQRDKKTEFNLANEELEIIEIANKETWEPLINVVALTTRLKPEGEYKFSIIVTGRDVPKTERAFVMSVDANGLLNVEAAN